MPEQAAMHKAKHLNSILIAIGIVFQILAPIVSFAVPYYGWLWFFGSILGGVVFVLGMYGVLAHLFTPKATAEATGYDLGNGCQTKRQDFDFLGRFWLEQNRTLWSRLQTIYLLEVVLLSGWYVLRRADPYWFVCVAMIFGSVALAVLCFIVIRDVEYLNKIGDKLGNEIPKPSHAYFRSGRAMVLLVPFVLIAVNMNLLTWGDSKTDTTPQPQILGQIKVGNVPVRSHGP